MNWVLNNPWMLLWGAAALIPLILYLLRRKTPQRIDWSAMQFLQDASRTPATKPKFKQWLLLAVRMMLPLLIALVAATPGHRNGNPDVIRKEPGATHWVLVFDVSASMGPRADGSSSIEESISNAGKIIEEAEIGDLFSVVSSGANQILQLSIASPDQETVRQRVETLKSSGGRFHPDRVLAAVSALVDESSTFTIERTHVVLFSDFAAGDWNFDKLELSTSTQPTDVRLVPCGRPDSNLAITRLSAIPNNVTSGQSFTCQVDLSNTNASTQMTAVVELFIDGNRFEIQEAQVDPDSTQSVFIDVPTDRTGDLEIEAVISANGLVIDDRRFLTVDVRREINVLCIEGQMNSSESFVAATTPVTGSRLPLVSTVVADLSQLVDINLESVDVLVLIEIDRFNLKQTRKIADFVINGGGALVSMGPNANIASWQGLMNALDSPSHRGQITGEIKQGEFRFEPLEYKHAIVKDFENQPQAGVIDVPIQRYYKLQFDSTYIGRILDYDTGDPALIELAAGRGKVILSTTPLSPTQASDIWNSLPAWWSYVPIINNSIIWMFGSSQRQFPLLIGDEPSVDLEEAVFLDQVIVESPATGKQNRRVVESDQGTRQIEISSDAPGFVRVQPDAAIGSDSRVFAFNVDHRESDLTQVDMTKLRSWFPSSSKHTNKKSNDSLGRSHFLYVFCLIMIGALLLIEPFLANRKHRFSPGSVT